MERLLVQRYYYTAAPIEKAHALLRTGIEPNGHDIELTRDKKDAIERAMTIGVQEGRMAILRVDPSFLEKKHMSLGKGMNRIYRGRIDPFALLITQVV